MIHYHGTPISPYSELDKCKGKSFCISYPTQRFMNWHIENAESLMLDNGAFSTYNSGKKFDEKGYYSWVDQYLYAMNWAVIPDVIGGSVEDQKELLSRCKLPKHLSAPVWHMSLSLSWLEEIADNYPRFCFGSSQQYWKVMSQEWQDRADEAFELLDKMGVRPWVHMLRGLRISGQRWPFASADSTNVARNFKNRGKYRCPNEWIQELNKKQTPLKFNKSKVTGDLDETK